MQLYVSIEVCLSLLIGCNAKHMTRNLRHLDLAQLWFKEKVADGTCVILKVDSKENNSDIGTKRVSKIIFEYLTHNLIDKSLRTVMILVLP